MNEKTQNPVAIIELGGKQHLVSQGAALQVNRLTNQEGDIIIVKDVLTGTTVQLKVVKHFLGKKISGLKFKNKVRYIRHYGHRQHLTGLEVTSFGEVAKTKETIKAVAAPKATEKKAAKKPTAAKKTTK